MDRTEARYVSSVARADTVRRNAHVSSSSARYAMSRTTDKIREHALCTRKPSKTNMEDIHTSVEELKTEEIAVTNIHPGPVIKILQVNMDRGRAAHNLAMTTAINWEMDSFLTEEYNGKMAAAAGLQVDRKKDVAIGIIGKRIRVYEAVDPGRGFIWTKISTGLT